MAKHYAFKKVKVDEFTTKIRTHRRDFDVVVKKQGNRWIAKAEGYCNAVGDTKRFAVVHLETNIKRFIV